MRDSLRYVGPVTKWRNNRPEPATFRFLAGINPDSGCSDREEVFTIAGNGGELLIPSEYDRAIFHIVVKDGKRVAVQGPWYIEQIDPVPDYAIDASLFPTWTPATLAGQDIKTLASEIAKRLSPQEVDGELLRRARLK